MASTAVKSPNRLVRPRAWMSEVVEVDGVLGAGAAADTIVSVMGRAWYPDDGRAARSDVEKLATPR